MGDLSMEEACACVLDASMGAIPPLHDAAQAPCSSSRGMRGDWRAQKHHANLARPEGAENGSMERGPQERTQQAGGADLWRESAHTELLGKGLVAEADMDGDSRMGRRGRGSRKRWAPA